MNGSYLADTTPNLPVRSRPITAIETVAEKGSLALPIAPQPDLAREEQLSDDIVIDWGFSEFPRLSQRQKLCPPDVTINF